MNFVRIDETWINMDNVIVIRESKDGLEISFLDGVNKAIVNDVTEDKSLKKDVWSAIERLDNKNHKVRIDGLKGETLNVKVVNK